MRYFYYFLYIGWHWNFTLAYFVIRHEIAGERKYGIRTTGTYNLSDAIAREDRQYATWYEPVNYYSAGWLFDRLQPADLQTGFLDVGCGKGRVLAMAAAYGFRHITGIDFSPKLYMAANRLRAELETAYADLSIAVHCVNARYYEVPDTTGVIFLFNPFDAPMMELFIEQVKKSLQRLPRAVKILYANPQCRQLWIDAGFRETDAFVKLVHLKGSVLEFAPGALTPGCGMLGK
ncbi:class I SAM-dependent methyltransferase [Chitinophaga sp.]|uniref:class I SAM-dependent methyltransferase n=1 Tax=Chitinophaga sp. TaxID=1869181 RepID=UPI0031D505C5